MARSVARVRVRTGSDALRLGSPDVWNVGLLIGGGALLVALVPPVRLYPVIDDWLYARAVGHMLHMQYTIPDWAQAISLAHIAWGALFASLFGFNFTSLGASTLVMGAICLASLYALMRHLHVSPTGAFLGAASLGVTPLFVNLSYSYMTDITFLGCLLVASLCYVRGLQGHSEWWLWAGSAVAAGAYLTRQFGVLLVFAVLAYMLWARRFTLRKALCVAALPAIAALAYALWASTQPAPLLSYYTSYASATAQVQASSGAGGWLMFAFDRLLRLTWVLSEPGLTFLPFVRLRHIAPRTMLLFMALVALQVVTILHYGTIFPPDGNELTREGFVMLGYNAAPVFSYQAWLILEMAGLFGFSCALAGSLDRLRSWVSSWNWRNWRQSLSSSAPRSGDESLLVYLFGAMTALLLVCLTPLLLDRYFLPVLPAILVLVARHTHMSRPWPPSRPWTSRVSLAWACVALCGMGIFSAVAERDYEDHMAARWQAAGNLVSAGVAPERIEGGFEWAGWNFYEQGVRVIRTRIRDGKPLDRAVSPLSVLQRSDYLISDIPVDGYTQVGQIPYVSILLGIEPRSVLVLRRNEVAP